MTLQTPHRRYEPHAGQDQSIIDYLAWEPHLPQAHFRRRLWEQATVLDVSANGALVRARTNPAITRGTRISIGRRNERGLVAVRRVQPTSNATLSDYGVQFLWLDPTMQAFFDAAISTQRSFDFE